MNLLLSLLISTFATALPLNMEGSWSTTGELLPSHQTRVVIQRVYNEAGRKKLLELEQNGFTCVYAQANTYRCHLTSITSWDVPETHREKLLNEFTPLAFDLMKTPGEPGEISKGDLATQWQMPLLAYNAFGKTDNVIYWELNGTNKLQFAIQGHLYWPHFINSERIYFRTPVIQTTREGHIQFFYDVTFGKKALN